MKIKFLHIPVLMLFALIGAFLQSCVPSDDECSPVETETYPIYDGVRARVPYSGYDTLTFIRTSTGDTHTFVGEGPKEGYHMTTATRTSEDCPPDNAEMGWINYTFISSTFSSKITVSIYYQSYGRQPNVDVMFNNHNYGISSVSISKPYSYDSLQIGEQVFFNIIKFSTDEDPDNNNFYVFYNTSFGILKFRFKNGEEWTLLSKK